jgi:uncharacterized protein
VNNAHTIQVLSGARVDPLNLRSSDIHVADIAHSLSLQCRFTGHCLTFLSVAEHSVRVLRALAGASLEVRKWALLHDAAEAYLRDIPSPLKSLPEFKAYREAEEAAVWAIAIRFDLPASIPEPVWIADRRMLATEVRDVMAKPARPWHRLSRPYPDRIEPWTWRNAEHQFLAECRRLGIR